MLLQPSRMIGWGAAPLILAIFFHSDITVAQNTATPDFPNSIQFHLEASSPVEIEAAELEVRTDALACGESATRIIPDDFEPGKLVAVDWTWELRRTGALPPGTAVWWQWVITAGGETLTTPEEKLVVVDQSRSWQEIKSDQVILYWYEGSDDFAQALLDAGQNTIDQLEADLATTLDTPVRMYVYADASDMQEATLFAPDWSGGLAFTEHSALLMAVDPENVEWGQRITSHEMTHIVAGRYSFSCVTSTPNWFEEGYAQVSEGETREYYVEILEGAVANNALLSIRELGQIFSNDPDLASLSYAQSESLVRFLIEAYGDDKIALLLSRFREGASEDAALMEVYGKDRDQLEAAWREWIGAQPVEATPAGSSTTPTPYPTYPPISEPPRAVAEIRPTAAYLVTPDRGSEDQTAAATAGEAPQMSRGMIVLIVAAALCAGAFGLAVAAIVVKLASKRPGQHGEPTE